MSDVATPNLPSRDFERTSEFYVALGFTEVWRDEGWMILKHGDLTLEFFPHPELDPLTSWFSCCLRLRSGTHAARDWRRAMRKLLAAVLLIFGLTTLAQQPDAKPLLSSEPEKVRQEYVRAYNARDIDTVVEQYAKDATLVSDGGTFRGQDEIRQWVKSGVDQGSTLETIEPAVEKSSNTIAYSAGRTRRLVGSVVHLGQYLIVMEKIGGEWRITQHFALSAGQTPTVNASPSAAPAPPDPLAVERWFVGSWICEGEQHASPASAAVHFTDKFTFEMALDGSWLTYQIQQTNGPLQGKRTLIGWGTWDGHAKVHVRRDMNIGGSRVDVTAPGWDGDTLVFTGYMIAGDEKLPIKQTLTKKGDAAYDSALVMTGAEGKPVEWEEESCKKIGK
jgi:ketosteroid isomerase-like protein